MKKNMILVGVACLPLLLAGCNKEASPDVEVSGAYDAVYTIDALQDPDEGSRGRPGALLGIYVSEFLSRGTSLVVESALAGAEINTQLSNPEAPDTEPDFALLQAYADALQVEVKSLLNRSPDREKSLNAYVEALKNVGNRSIARAEELDAELDILKDERRALSKEVSKMNRERDSALRDNDFSTAGELQEALIDKQQELAELEAEESKLDSIYDAFDQLNDVYKERLLAIESNREALIAGISVVDVPGAEDLDILESPSSREQRSRLDSLFDGDMMLDITP